VQSDSRKSGGKEEGQSDRRKSGRPGGRMVGQKERRRADRKKGFRTEGKAGGQKEGRADKHKQTENPCRDTRESTIEQILPLYKKKLNIRKYLLKKIFGPVYKNKF
jgi:hypothetical protein